MYSFHISQKYGSARGTPPHPQILKIFDLCRKKKEKDGQGKTAYEIPGIFIMKIKTLTSNGYLDSKGYDHMWYSLY